jgi:hypothetical protein
VILICMLSLKKLKSGSRVRDLEMTDSSREELKLREPETGNRSMSHLEISITSKKESNNVLPHCLIGRYGRRLGVGKHLRVFQLTNRRSKDEE